MNRRMVLYTVGTVAKLIAALMVLPLAVSLIYGEDCYMSFLISIVISLAFGFALSIFSKPSSKVIYAREGFVIVSLAWIVISALGALPFFISGEIPSYIDAFFEMVSGFTTTGASILTDVEAMSKGLLFWRSFSHWIGGMGVLVFVLAVMPSVSDRSIHILRAESPGPIVGKIVPKMRETARILYLIYIVFTLAEIIFLLFGGLSVFESVVYSLGTAGTGGFGIKADGMASYSPYVQWVITVFMLVFGVNFNFYYLILSKRLKTAIKSEEVWTYLGIVLVCGAVITANILPKFGNLSDAIRHAFFQVSSIITTTGYATDDFNLWPGFSKTIILLLMFTGACAGSTAGGFKLSRVVIIVKEMKAELKKMLHPRSVSTLHFEGKRIDNTTVKSVMSYLGVYVLIYCVVVLLLGFDDYDIESNVSVAASCFNNIGPALSVAGPASSYAMYSPFSKVVLSFAMLFGRLEIIPMIITFSPSTWVKKK